MHFPAMCFRGVENPSYIEALNIYEGATIVICAAFYNQPIKGVEHKQDTGPATVAQQNKIKHISHSPHILHLYEHYATSCGSVEFLRTFNAPTSFIES